MWWITFALAVVILAGNFLAGNIGGSEEKPDVSYHIEVSDIIAETETIEDTAETDLKVDKYKKTRSDTNPKILEEVDTYSAGGTLKERAIYTEMDKVSQGITKSDGNRSCKTWSISADGTETFVSNSLFTIDENGTITKESIIEEEGSSVPVGEIQYTYTTAGNVSSAAAFSYNESEREMQRVSTITYTYNKKGVLTASSCTYVDTSKTATKSEYLNNNQKNPVKVTTTDYDNSVVSREERGYYRTGKIAFYKIYSQEGALYEKMYFTYDKSGDLKSTVKYILSDAGVLGVNEIKIYRYR